MKKKIINLSPILFITVLLGNFLVTFLLGFFYNNYSHLEMVMSELGSSNSPVSFWMSLYWIIYGIIIILFGYSFHQTYNQKKIGRIIGYLFVLIGIGVGLFSGFPMDSKDADVTLYGKFHDIGNGIGFLAILITPFFLFRFFQGDGNKGIRKILIIVQILGLLFLGLFIASEDGDGAGIAKYIGLWQRLYLACYYTIFRRNRQKFVAKIGVKYKCVMYLSAYFYLGE